MVYVTINNQVSEKEEGAMLWYSKACFRVRKHGTLHPNLIINREMDHLVVLADYLTAGAGAQGLQGFQRHGLVQKVDRAVHEDHIRAA